MEFNSIYEYLNVKPYKLIRRCKYAKLNLVFILLCGLHKMCCKIYVAGRQNGKRKSKTAAPALFSIFSF